MTAPGRGDTGGGSGASTALRFVALACGALATAPVLMLGELVAGLAQAAADVHLGLAAAFLNAAIPEETSKLVALALVLTAARAAHPSDAMLPPVARRPARVALEAGFALGLGFALVETLLQVARLAASPDADQALGVAAARAVTALPLHAGVGALAGCYLALRSPAKAWVVAIALHGLYDLAIFEAARGAGVLVLAVGYGVLALVVAWALLLYVWTAASGEAQASSRFSPL